MTDLLTIAEAHIAEKQCQEIENIKKRLEDDRDTIKAAIELVNTHTLYKKVCDGHYRGCSRYELATEEMLKADYLKEKPKYGRGGIRFMSRDSSRNYNSGILEVNGEVYYDIRYALENYEEDIKDKKNRIHSLTKTICEYEDELKALHEAFPTLKKAVEEYMKYRYEHEREYDY